MVWARRNQGWHAGGEEDGEDLEEDTTSRGRKRSQDQHQSRKKRQKEPKKVDHGNGNVTAHNLVWKFVDDMAVDAFKDTRFKPKLHVADPSTLSVIDFWLLFFPSNSTDEILHYTNAQLRSRQKLITNGQLYKFCSLLYAMTLDIRTQRREY